jgi:hypothetical protein
MWKRAHGKERTALVRFSRDSLSLTTDHLKYFTAFSYIWYTSTVVHHSLSKVPDFNVGQWKFSSDKWVVHSPTPLVLCFFLYPVAISVVPSLCQSLCFLSFIFPFSFFPFFLASFIRFFYYVFLLLCFTLAFTFRPSCFHALSFPCFLPLSFLSLVISILCLSLILYLCIYNVFVSFSPLFLVTVLIVFLVSIIVACMNNETLKLNTKMLTAQFGVGPSRIYDVRR